MKLLLLSIFSFCLLQTVLGQDNTPVQQDTTAQQDTTTQQDMTAVEQTGDSLVVMAVPRTVDADTTPAEKPRFIQPALSFDYGKLITTIAGLDEKYEVGGSFIFLEQYLLVGEVGSAILEPENAFRNGTYRSEGMYYRMGGGFINQINLSSKLGIGALYGISSFRDQGAVYISSNSDVQGDFTNTFDRQGLEARWLEVFLTSESWLRLNKGNPESPINRRFALGFQIKFRFLTSYDSFELFDVYAIPGYGRSVNDPQVAVNLFVKFYPF